jgi:hypothetical protein
MLRTYPGQSRRIAMARLFQTFCRCRRGSFHWDRSYGNSCSSSGSRHFGRINFISLDTPIIMKIAAIKTPDLGLEGQASILNSRSQMTMRVHQTIIKVKHRADLPTSRGGGTESAEPGRIEGDMGLCTACDAALGAPASFSGVEERWKIEEKEVDESREQHLD